MRGYLKNVAVLEKYKRQLDDIERGLEDEAYKILSQVQDIIVSLNTDQLLSGLTPEGQKIVPKYSRIRYARAKNQFNPLPGFGTPDLKLTGKFHSDFFLTAKNKEFTLFSSDDKTGKLVEKYGQDNIFGLTVENNRIVNYEILAPRLIEWVLSKLKI